MKKRTAFQDFDNLRHQKYLVQVESITFEIWHSIGTKQEEIERIAKTIFETEKKSSRELLSFYKLDIRP